MAAENKAGTGPYVKAQVIVPQFVDLYDWVANPFARDVGLNAGGDTPRDCGKQQSQICAQSLSAGTVSPSGVNIAFAEQS